MTHLLQRYYEEYSELVDSSSYTDEELEKLENLLDDLQTILIEADSITSKIDDIVEQSMANVMVYSELEWVDNEAKYLQ